MIHIQWLLHFLTTEHNKLNKNLTFILEVNKDFTQRIAAFMYPYCNNNDSLVDSVNWIL
jgi:hypothetical protein